MLRLSLSVAITLLASKLVEHGVRCENDQQSKFVLYEAEANTGVRNSFFETSEGNYTGTGYMNFNDMGFVEWDNVEAFDGAGKYALRVRYAVANKPGRACHVFLNDEKEVAGVFKFPYTGGYGEWKFDEIAVQLNSGTNKVRIEAIYKGPHVDSMEVSFKAPSIETSTLPTIATEGEKATSTTPKPTTVPTTTKKPVESANRETANKEFQLKMFFEKGMTWQESFKRKAWCVQCTECKPRGDTKIKECNEKDDLQFWTYEGGRLRSAEKKDLCLEMGLPDSKKVRMGVCDNNNEKQVWLGFDKTKKFQFRALRYPNRCLTQEHHPKSGEHLIMEDCHEAQENDGSINNPNDDTSHWVIGKWTGHSDEGVKVFRHHQA